MLIVDLGGKFIKLSLAYCVRFLQTDIRLVVGVVLVVADVFVLDLLLFGSAARGLGYFTILDIDPLDGSKPTDWRF